MKRLLLLAFAGIVVNGYELPKDIAVEKASHAVHELHVMMKKNVKERIRKEGIESAVHFCSEESFERIEKLDKSLGDEIHIKRVSLRNRNPNSYPKTDEKDILKAFDLLEESDVYMPKNIVQIKEDNRYKVYFPSTMSSRNCKSCHGQFDKMNKEVRTFLKEKYPNDRAFDFTSGEVRGAVVIDITLKNKKEKK